MITGLEGRRPLVWAAVTVSRGSTTARLARVGFTEPSRAAELIYAPALAGLAGDDRLLAALAATADPDAALIGLTRLLEAAEDADDLLRELDRNSRLRGGLLHVLGASQALTEHLVRHPEHWQLLADADAAGGTLRPSAAGLRAEMLTAVGADFMAAEPVASATNAADALRVAYRGAVLRLAARDLTGSVDVTEVAAELA